MKVVIVNRHPVDVLGGSETQCDNIASELTQRDHDVVYVAPSGTKESIYDRSYRVVSVRSDGAAISKAVIAERPDVVYWRFNKNNLFVAARKIAAAGIPIVYAVSHIDDTKAFTYLANTKGGLIQRLKAVKQSLTSFINYQGFKYISGVTYLNEQYMGLLNVSPEKYVPNSVDETEEEFDWPRPFVIWVSNIKRDKRPEIYYDIAKHFEGSGVDFLMVGSMMSKVHDYLTVPQAISNFYYLGPKSVRQVNGMLAKAMFMVHTCKPEGFGNNFIQAWLRGKPTVSFGFDPGGYINRFDLGGVADDDWNKMTKLVGALIADPASRADHGRKALNFAKSSFSKKITVDALLPFLIKVSKLRPGGR